MLRLALYIAIGWIALAIVFVIAWSRLKHWDAWTELEDEPKNWAQRAPEEKKEPDALASASRSDFESRRFAKGFEKRPRDAA